MKNIKVFTCYSLMYDEDKDMMYYQLRHYLITLFGIIPISIRKIKSETYYGTFKNKKQRTEYALEQYKSGEIKPYRYKKYEMLFVKKPGSKFTDTNIINTLYSLEKKYDFKITCVNIGPVLCKVKVKCNNTEYDKMYSEFLDILSEHIEKA